MDEKIVIVRKNKSVKRIEFQPKTLQVRDIEHIESYFIPDPAEALPNLPPEPKVKPTVIFTTGHTVSGKEMTIGDRAAYVWNCIQNGTPFNIEVTRNFLIDNARRIGGESPLDWESYGIQIANQGEPVNPVSVLNVVVSPSLTPTSFTPSILAGTSDNMVLLQVLMTLRLGRHTDPGHRKLFEDRCTAMLKSQFTTTDVGVPFYANFDNAVSLIADKGISRLTAAFDMVLEFLGPKDPIAYMRIGTLHTRYDEMQAMNALCSLASDLGMSMDELCTWGFVSTLGDDFEVLFDVSEAFQLPGSYGPYIMSMKLNSGSTFSAAQRGAAFTFVHMIGTILDIERSQKAYVVQCKNKSKVADNAKLAAFMFHHYSTVEQRFRKESQAARVDEVLEVEGDPALEGLPQKCNAAMTFAWYKSCPSLPLAIENFANRRWMKIIHERDGTFGKLLKAEAVALSQHDQRNYYNMGVM